MGSEAVVGQIYLIRHGETEWSLSGRHTGLTDLPLTARGEAQARSIGERLRALEFSTVLTSPLQRARRTCELAALEAPTHREDALCEWHYGQYEGLTGAQIRQRQPGWDVFRNGCPDGESPEQVCRRADGLIERLRGLDGRVALFSHGHFLRALAVRWIGLPLVHGSNFGLEAGAISQLGYEHQRIEEPAIELWNMASGV
jgi:probable phosphoglycerate mutase